MLLYYSITSKLSKNEMQLSLRSPGCLMPTFLLFLPNLHVICFTFSALPSQSSTEKSSAWRVAVIVLGVLLGVALLLIFVVISAYIWMKRRSGKYIVEPKELLGNFVYRHL